MPISVADFSVIVPITERFGLRPSDCTLTCRTQSPNTRGLAVLIRA
jgi:hypothetical protein